MSDLFPIIVGSLLGIVGALAAVSFTHALAERAGARADAISRELKHLELVEAAFKHLCSGLLNELVTPTPFPGRRTISALRELVYLGPVTLPPNVVSEVLVLCNKASTQRTYRALARRWILGDIEQAQALVVELAEAETAIATAIVTRRQDLLAEPRRLPRMPLRSGHAATATVAVTPSAT